MRERMSENAIKRWLRKHREEGRPQSARRIERQQGDISVIIRQRQPSRPVVIRTVAPSHRSHRRARSRSRSRTSSPTLMTAPTQGSSTSVSPRASLRTPPASLRSAKLQLRSFCSHCRTPPRSAWSLSSVGVTGSVAQLSGLCGAPARSRPPGTHSRGACTLRP